MRAGRYGKIGVCLQRLNHQPICSEEKSMKMQKSLSGPCVRLSGCQCVRHAVAAALSRENGGVEIDAGCYTNSRG